MTRFLDIIRRIFGWGSISYIIVIFCNFLGSKSEISDFQAFYLIYFMLSPIFYLLFAVISVAYFRKHGEYEDIFQEHNPFTNFFMCLGMDITAPLNNIIFFFIVLIKKNAEEKNKRIRYFIEMMVLILFCGIGLLVIKYL